MPIKAISKSGVHFLARARTVSCAPVEHCGLVSAEHLLDGWELSGKLAH
jgi:hypothetical protein